MILGGAETSRSQKQPQVRNEAGRMFGPWVGLGWMGMEHGCDSLHNIMPQVDIQERLSHSEFCVS